LSQDAFNIEIADEQSYPIDGDALIAIAKAIVIEYGFKQVELSIAAVDDPTIRRLNREYLGHDYETDVISFVLDSGESNLNGQLIVSTDTAQRVAEEIDSKLHNELMLYVTHGTLHLVGLDDLDPDSAQEMRAAEKRFLEMFSIEHRWIGEPFAKSADEDEEGAKALPESSAEKPV
jgi:probable rRNA maturation factor